MDVKRSAEFDLAYIRMAHIWGRLSRAQRKKVGCLVVKNNTIISDGFNGTPTGFDNECEYTQWDDQFIKNKDNHPEKLVTRPEVLHAESNAITKLAKSTQSSTGATMYITISPCIECAKLIIQSGISRVVYGEMYRNTEGVDLLKKASIIVDTILN